MAPRKLDASASRPAARFVTAHSGARDKDGRLKPFHDAPAAFRPNLTPQQMLECAPRSLTHRVRAHHSSCSCPAGKGCTAGSTSIPLAASRGSCTHDPVTPKGSLGSPSMSFRRSGSKAFLQARYAPGSYALSFQLQRADEQSRRKAEGRKRETKGVGGVKERRESRKPQGVLLG